MTIRLQPHAERSQPNEILLRFDQVMSPEAVPQSWFTPAFWTLERLISGQWQTEDSSVLASCRITTVMEDQTLVGLSFCFQRLNGVYRLCAMDNVGDPFLEDGWNRVPFALYAADHEPYYLEVEGCRFGSYETMLPYFLVDQDKLPGSLSEKVNVREGSIQHSGLTLTLVDLPNEGDGVLTELFAPKRGGRVGTLTNGVDATSASLNLDSPESFHPGEVVFVGREAIRLGVREVNGFSSCIRGMARTVRTAHEKGSLVRDWNPVWEGRRLWVKDHLDRVLYSGIIERIEPADNLACYTVTAHSALETLERSIGEGRLARATLSGRFTLEAGHNRLFVLLSALGYDDGAPTTEILTVDLEPGHYDITPGTENSGRFHLAGALYRALARVQPRVASCDVQSVRINHRGELSLCLSSRARRLVLHDDIEQARGGGSSTQCGGLLRQLGFQGGPLESVSVSALDEPVFHTFTAQDALCAGLWEEQTEIAFQENASVGQLVRPARDIGKVVRINEELIGYEDWITDAGQEVSTTLASSVSPDGETLVFSSARFQSRDLVRIGSEILLLGTSQDGLSFRSCVRGAEGTSLASHAVGELATRIPRPRLTGCRRGLFGTRATAHKAGDSVVQVVAGGAAETAQREASYWPMTTFLARLLWEAETTRLPMERSGLDTQSLFLALASVNGAADGSFFGLADGETRYQDWLNALLPCLDLFLLLDNKGRLTFRRMEPLLLHQDVSSLTLDQMQRPPTVRWEQQTLSQVTMSLDREPGRDRHTMTLLFKKDEEEALRVFGHGDNKRSRKADGLYSSASARNGSAETSLYRVARQMMARHKAPLMTLAVDVPLSSFLGNDLPELLHSLRINCPHIPCGDGTRGLDQRAFWVVERDVDLARGLVRLGLMEQLDTRVAGLSLCLSVTGVEGNTVQVQSAGLWPDFDQINPRSMLTQGCALRLLPASGVATGSLAPSAPCVLNSVDFPETWPDGMATLTLQSLPTPTPQAGDVFIAAAYDASCARLQAFAHLADEAETLGLGNDPAHRYW